MSTNGSATYQQDAADLERRSRSFLDRIFGGLNIRGEYERTLIEGQALQIALLQQLLAQAGGTAAAGSGGGTAGGGSGGSGSGTTAGGQLSGGLEPTAAVQLELPVATVGANSTPTSLVMQLGNPPQPVSLSSAEATNLKNARIVFLGGAMAGQVREISAVTTAGIITPDAAYESTPLAGMQFVLVPTASTGGATSPNTNIAQVGGTAQTAADWTSLFSAANTTLSTNEQVTVDTSAVRLDTGISGRRSLIVFNNNASSGAVLYVGGADTVTTASGYPIPAQGALALNMGPGLELYGITGSSADVRVLELA